MKIYKGSVKLSGDYRMRNWDETSNIKKQTLACIQEHGWMGRICEE
jgi:hypothetical protein